MRLPILLLAVAVTLAGCLQAAPTHAPATTPADPGRGGAAAATDRLVAHNASGALPVPPTWEQLRVRLAPAGVEGGEPTVGVTADGAIFATGVSPMREPYVVRSRDHGRTWERVDNPILTPPVDFDPWLWVDPATDRVYHAPSNSHCAWLTWSDDGGARWDANPLGCDEPLYNDFQKLTTGPPAPGVETAGYPSVVYYSYNSLRRYAREPPPVEQPSEGTVVAVSLDGGRTFREGTIVHPPDPCFLGFAGPVGVSPDGTAYVASATCDGVQVAASTDSGASWTLGPELTAAGVSPVANSPDVAVDAAGAAHLVYTGGDGRVRLSTSRDGGATWTRPVVASPPGVSATIFATAAAGAPGGVAIAYLGTSANATAWGADPSAAPPGTEWHLYLTFTRDAGAANPVFVTLRATPGDDPAQRGCIYRSGGDRECRNLYDFMGMAQRGGRAYVAFADGCLGCARASGSRDALLTVAVVEEGPSLAGGLLAALGRG